MKFTKLFGPRIAVTDVTSDVENGLALPASRTQLYFHVQVEVVGDGRVMDKVEDMDVKVGDTMVVQFNPMLTKAASQVINGKPTFVLHHRDAIMRAPVGKPLSLDDIEMVGHWVLCKVNSTDSLDGIFLPDTAKSTTGFKNYELAKWGPYADLNLPAGTSVYLDKTRANRLTIGGQEFVYVDKMFVMGVELETVNPLE